MKREKSYSAWDLSKIGKAIDLKRICPHIDKDKGWEAFAKEFNKPRHCSTRQKSASHCQRPQPHPEIREIEQLCFTIRNRIPANLDRHERPDGSTFYLTEEQATQKKIDAAISLVENVRMILSPSDQGERLRRKFEAEANRKSKGAKKESTTELCLALLEFIRREERLPSKKELNREANRLKHCRTEYPAEKNHGDTIQPEGTSSIADRLIVYDCGAVAGLNEARNLVTRMECRIVPWAEWDEPRWTTTSYSDLSTPCGLKGLPEANEDKGPGKVRR